MFSVALPQLRRIRVLRRLAEFGPNATACFVAYSNNIFFKIKKSLLESSGFKYSDRQHTFPRSESLGGVGSCQPSLGTYEGAIMIMILPEKWINKRKFFWVKNSGGGDSWTGWKPRWVQSPIDTHLGKLWQTDTCLKIRFSKEPLFKTPLLLLTNRKTLK